MKWVYKFQDFMNTTPDELKIAAVYAAIFFVIGFVVGFYII